eukprot:341941-Rhodomonas_salina.6
MSNTGFGTESCFTYVRSRPLFHTRLLRYSSVLFWTAPHCSLLPGLYCLVLMWGMVLSGTDVEYGATSGGTEPKMVKGAAAGLLPFMVSAVRFLHPFMLPVVPFRVIVHQFTMAIASFVTMHSFTVRMHAFVATMHPFMVAMAELGLGHVKGICSAVPNLVSQRPSKIKCKRPRSPYTFHKKCDCAYWFQY